MSYDLNKKEVPSASGRKGRRRAFTNTENRLKSPITRRLSIYEYVSQNASVIRELMENYQSAKSMTILRTVESPEITTGLLRTNHALTF